MEATAEASCEPDGAPVADTAKGAANDGAREQRRPYSRSREGNAIYRSTPRRRDCTVAGQRDPGIPATAARRRSRSWEGERAGGRRRWVALRRGQENHASAESTRGPRISRTVLGTGMRGAGTSSIRLRMSDVACTAVFAAIDWVTCRTLKTTGFGRCRLDR